MAVPVLNLKELWESGQYYSDWLAGTKNPHMKSEMERFYAEAAIPPAIEAQIKNLKRVVYVLALIEDWCGDVRRHAPVLAKLCALNPEKIKLRCVDKETKPQLMVRYLTNAAEAIPIFIFFNEAFVEIGNWGPRPSACKKAMARGKAAGKIEEAREFIYNFYLQDAHQSTLSEIAELVAAASAESV